MEEGDDDDIYAPDESTGPEAAVPSRNGVGGFTKKEPDNADEDEEEGEEVEEGSDSVSRGALIPLARASTDLIQDIDIITERKGVPETKNESA